MLSSHALNLNSGMPGRYFSTFYRAGNSRVSLIELNSHLELNGADLSAYETGYVLIPKTSLSKSFMSTPTKKDRRFTRIRQLCAQHHTIEVKKVSFFDFIEPQSSQTQ